MRIAESANGQMTTPAPALMLEPALGGCRLDARCQRAKLDAMQSDEDCARMLETRKSSEPTRSDLERRGLSRDFMQTRRQPLEPKRVDSRTEEFEGDMQIGARNPSDTVARALDRVAHRTDCVLDLLVHPNRDERAHWLQVVRRKVLVGTLSWAVFRPISHRTSRSASEPLLFALRAFAFLSAGRRTNQRESACSTSGNLSLPKNIEPSTNIVGDPNPPRAISSSVFSRSLALYSSEVILVKNSFSSRPTSRTISRSTSSLLISRSSPQ